MSDDEGIDPFDMFKRLMRPPTEEEMNELKQRAEKMKSAQRDLFRWIAELDATDVEQVANLLSAMGNEDGRGVQRYLMGLVHMRRMVVTGWTPLDFDADTFLAAMTGNTDVKAEVAPDDATEVTDEDIILSVYPGEDGNWIVSYHGTEAVFANHDDAMKFATALDKAEGL